MRLPRVLRPSTTIGDYSAEFTFANRRAFAHFSEGGDDTGMAAAGGGGGEGAHPGAQYYRRSDRPFLLRSERQRVVLHRLQMAAAGPLASQLARLRVVQQLARLQRSIQQSQHGGGMLVSALSAAASAVRRRLLLSRGRSRSRSSSGGVLSAAALLPTLTAIQSSLMASPSASPVPSPLPADTTVATTATTTVAAAAATDAEAATAADADSTTPAAAAATVGCDGPGRGLRRRGRQRAGASEAAATAARWRQGAMGAAAEVGEGVQSAVLRKLEALGRKGSGSGVGGDVGSGGRRYGVGAGITRRYGGALLSWTSDHVGHFLWGLGVPHLLRRLAPFHLPHSAAATKESIRHAAAAARLMIQKRRRATITSGSGSSGSDYSGAAGQGSVSPVSADDSSLLQECKQAGLFLALFPPHSPSTRRSLARLCVWVPPYTPQPIAALRSYFGEKVALSFAWLEFHNWALLCPSLPILAAATLSPSALCVDGPLLAPLSVATPLLCALYLCLWRRQQACLALRWDMRGFDAEERLLAFAADDLDGCDDENGVTGTGAARDSDRRGHDSNSNNSSSSSSSSSLHSAARVGKRVGVTLCFLLLSGVNVAALLLVMWIRERHSNPRLAKLLMGAFAFLFSMAYERLAVAVNNWQTHSTASAKQNELVQKVVFLLLPSSFLPPLHAAFWAQDLSLLREQLVALLFTKRLLGLLSGMAGPWVATALNGLRSYQLTLLWSAPPAPAAPPNGAVAAAAAATEAPTTAAADTAAALASAPAPVAATAAASSAAPAPIRLTGCERQFIAAEYSDVAHARVMANTVFQFGYLALFGAAFPMAFPLAAAVNAAEIKSIGYRLCHALRRPLPLPAVSLGLWYNVLLLFTLLAALSNAAMIVVACAAHPRALAPLERLPLPLVRSLPHRTLHEQVMLAVGVEHAVLASVALLMLCCPAEPYDVIRTEASRERKRRRALKRAQRARRGSFAAAVQHRMVHTLRERLRRQQQLAGSSAPPPHTTTTDGAAEEEEQAVSSDPEDASSDCNSGC